MGKERAAIHTNFNLPHQIEFAEYLSHGLNRHGVNSCITADPKYESDIHIVLGPHYAKSQWLGHNRTILLDRCYWGDAAKVVTLGWMTPDGGRVIPQNCPHDRDKPDLKPMKTGDRAIYLVDYGEKPDHHIVTLMGATVRYHPVDRPSDESMDEALERHDIAIGYGTSAMITAAIQGLQIICFDHRNPAKDIGNRVQWLSNLSYMNWSGEEIYNGDPFEYLL